MSSWDYHKDLKSAKWKKFADKIKEKYNWKCSECGTIEHKLQIHHKIYISGRRPWEYNENCLTCLCDLCHFMNHVCAGCGNKLIGNEHGMCMKCLEIIQSIPKDFEIDLNDPKYWQFQPC